MFPLTSNQQAIQSHERTNCINDVIIEAEEWAKTSQANENNSQLLAGIPISIKDHYSMKVN